MLKLYENIKKRREELGMSQETLAKLVGYTNRSTIARIEHGDIDLPQSMITKFAHALQTSPSLLMGWEWDEPESYYLDPEVAEMAQELYERPEMRVLFDASRKATREDIEQVAIILERLSQK